MNDRKGADVSEDVAIAQIVTAIITVFYAPVFAIGYHFLIKVNRETLREMREQRISGGRPQVTIEARYGRLPTVDLAVRNFGGGVAKDITFDFSAPIEDSTGFVLSELPYFEEGINFLGPGEEVASIWDDRDNLVSSLREKGPDGGILVRVRYQDLVGESYETDWRINPLIYQDDRHVPPQNLRAAETLLSALTRVYKNTSWEPTEETIGRSRRSLDNAGANDRCLL